MGLFDGIFDKEGMVKATIEQCLESVAEEQGCKPTELFIMIKPTRDEFVDDKDETNFKNWVYKLVDGVPTKIREISLKEILGDED